MSEGDSNARPGGKTRRLLLTWTGVLLAAALGMIWLAGGFDRQPTYHGRPASYWLDHAQADNPVLSPGGGAEAEEAFRVIGLKALPFLVKTMERKPSRLLIRLDEFADDHWVDRPKWLARLLPDLDQMEVRRIQAASWIGKLGPVAAAAIPALARRLGDPAETDELQEEAGEALKAMGEAAAMVLPELKANLKSTNEDVQVTSAEILGNIGPKALPAAPLLKAATAKPDQFGLSCARALWHIENDSQTLLQVCSNVLAQSGSDLRMQSIDSLCALGPVARPLAPMLQAALRDKDVQVRWRAAKALREIDAEVWEAGLQEINREIPTNVAELIERVRDGNRASCAIALRALSVLGPQAAAGVPALLEVLDREPPEPTISTQPQFGRSLANAAPGTFTAPLTVHPQRSQVSRIVAATLAEIGPEARAAVPRLVALLQEHRGLGAAAYCKALGGIGPDARAAIPVLEDFLKSDLPEMRLSAAEALSKIAPEQASEAIPVLKAFPDYRDADEAPPTGNRRLLPTLVGVPQGTQRYDFTGNFPAGYTLVGVPQGTQRYDFPPRAAVALWRFHALDEPPAEFLMRRVERMHLPNDIELLGEIGPQAKAALPVLTNCLDQDYLPLRQIVATAIRKIDPDEAAKLGLPAILAQP
jgi:HEAT repeat protein